MKSKLTSGGRGSAALDHAWFCRKRAGRVSVLIILSVCLLPIGMGYAIGQPMLGAVFCLLMGPTARQIAEAATQRLESKTERF